MRQQLINPAQADVEAQPRNTRRFGRLRGGVGEDEATLVFGCGGCCVCMLFLCMFFIASLGPNQYGLMRNYLTGGVDDEVYRGGIHIVAPWKGYIKWPAAMSTLEFSAQNYEAPPIQARTGAAPGQKEGGGQSIVISCAVQYMFMSETLKEVYMTFGSYEAAIARFFQLTKMAISGTTNDYTPQDFWSKRKEITAEMLQKINHTLWNEGHVQAHFFQILKVEFQTAFEDSITRIQVAEQQKVVNENEQKVQRVLQGISVMNSHNQAKIANISSYADAHSKEIVAQAKKTAFGMTQGAKATNYKQLKSTLGLSDAQLREYFKIKAVQASGASGGKVVVGLPTPGGVPSGKAGNRRLQSDDLGLGDLDWHASDPEL